MSESPAEMARTWLRAWATHDLSLLRLAPDFVHTSPLGRIEGLLEDNGRLRGAIATELDS